MFMKAVSGEKLEPEESVTSSLSKHRGVDAMQALLTQDGRGGRLQKICLKFVEVR